MNSSCVNTIGSFTCNCLPGYTRVNENGVCVDINECVTDPCNLNAQCVNSPGSYTCECMPGFEADTIDSEKCVDINECLTGSHACHEDSICENTEGSFNCECEIGFVGDGENCEDVNECSNGMNTCQANSECENTIGSFTCFCVTGYDFNDDSECVDVDECQFDPCGNHMTCQNSFGSYQCACNDGYQLDTGGQHCVDIDECTADPCPQNSSCSNKQGSFMCVCDDGFVRDGTECIDVNECSSSEHNCDHNATCDNTIGSYECECNDGFSGDEVCVDIDECSNGSHDCDRDGMCVNTIGSFKCKNVRHRLADCPPNIQITGLGVPQFYLGIFKRERKFLNGMATYRKRNLRMLYSHGRWRVVDKQGRSLLRSALLVRQQELEGGTESTDSNIDGHEWNFDERAINGFICPSDLSKGWEILKPGVGWFIGDVKIQKLYAQKSLESSIFDRCQNELSVGQESLGKPLVNQLILMLKKFKRKSSTNESEYRKDLN